MRASVTTKRSRTRRAALPLATAIAGVLLAGPALAADQLVLIPDLTLLLALMGLFAVLVFPANAMVFRPLLRVLDEREEQVDGKRTRAQQLERQAQEVLEKYESSIRQVREEAEQARRGALEEARSVSQGTTGDARGEAEREIERARAEIASELDSARVTMRSEAQLLAREAASAVLGRPL